MSVIILFAADNNSRKRHRIELRHAVKYGNKDIIRFSHFVSRKRKLNSSLKNYFQNGSKISSTLLATVLCLSNSLEDVFSRSFVEQQQFAKSGERVLAGKENILWNGIKNYILRSPGNSNLLSTSKYKPGSILNCRVFTIGLPKWIEDLNQKVIPLFLKLSNWFENVLDILNFHSNTFY